MSIGPSKHFTAGPQYLLRKEALLQLNFNHTVVCLDKRNVGNVRLWGLLVSKAHPSHANHTDTSLRIACKAFAGVLGGPG